MISKGKYIGLNQRVPIDVLDSAIRNYLEIGSVDKDQLNRQMQEHTQGLNRAGKAADYIVQILNRQRYLLDQFGKNFKSSNYNFLSSTDRKAFILSLIALTYPIVYDLLIALSQGFKVQNQINKHFINEKVKTIYGSNRTVDVAIDAMLPMIIELGAIKRERVSIYSLGYRQNILHKYVAELIVYTDIKLSGSKSILSDDIGQRPWYGYFNIEDLMPVQWTYLLQEKDSSIGKAYITTK